MGAPTFLAGAVLRTAAHPADDMTPVAYAYDLVGVYLFVATGLLVLGALPHPLRLGLGSALTITLTLARCAAAMPRAERGQRQHLPARSARRWPLLERPRGEPEPDPNPNPNPNPDLNPNANPNPTPTPHQERPRGQRPACGHALLRRIRRAPTPEPEPQPKPSP